MQKSIAELGAALRDGSVTAEALRAEATANHAAHADSFGAYKLWDPERARSQATAADAALKSGAPLGPLHGIPISVKDLFGVEGWPTFAGTPKQLPEADWSREGPVISALRAQLGTLMGKTHTVEFAFGGIGANPHWGAPRNPWDQAAARAPGGSSSGAGVSLVAGSALVALGTDTAGSVRIPASMTGNVGLKTGHGRWSIDFIAPLSPSLDTPGVLARTAADAAAAFVAIDPAYAATRAAPEMPREADISTLRLGVPETYFWEDCSPGVAEGVRGAIAELEKKGAKVVPCPLPEAEVVYPIFQAGGLASVELHTFVQDELPDWKALIDPIVVQRMEEAAELPAHEYVRRQRVMAKMAAAADMRLREVDVLLTPTVPITPPVLDDVAEVAKYRPANWMTLRNTGIANYLRLTALTLPVALDVAGMPVGLQLIGRWGEEERLLSIGIGVERAIGTGRERLGRAPMLAA